MNRFQTICFWAVAAIFIAAVDVSAQSTGPLATSEISSSTEVWIGGGLAWGELINPATKNQWDFLQQNVDGFYINNFAMRRKADDGAHRELLDRLVAMRTLLTHKRVFYETDLIHAASDEFDTGSLALFDQAGFEYAGATINYGNSPARTAILTKHGQYPLFYMFGPWKQNGDINDGKNTKLRQQILAQAGAAVDGPMTMWMKDAGQMQHTVYSTIQWCHAHQKKFLYLLAPNDSGSNFLSAAKNLLHGLEDHQAMPDLIAVSFYGPKIFRDKLAVLPEKDASGKASETFSGTAYWVVNHLKDPQHFARLSTSQTNLSVSAGQTITVSLNNSSQWLDLTPVVRASVAGNQADWDLRWFIGSRDVTSEMTGEGLSFLSGLRLDPERREDISLKIVRTPSAQAASDLTVQLDLRPNPSQMEAEQTLTLHLRIASLSYNTNRIATFFCVKAP